MQGFKLDFDLYDISDDDLIDAYNNATGILHRFDTNQVDRQKIKSLLEDMEDLAKERELDL